MPKYSNFKTYYKPMYPRLLELIEIHGMTQFEAAKVLNSEGFTTERGGRIVQSVVSRALAVARHERRIELSKQRELAETR